MHVGLVFNQRRTLRTAGPEPGNVLPNDVEAEWDDPETIQAVADALSSRHRVTRIEADEDAFETLRSRRPDLVFNMAEGATGASRESQIPAMLEMLGIPYTASDPITLGICLDKSRTKEILAHHGIPTPSYAVVENATDLNGQISPPAVVKPLWEGSSKGVTNDSLARDYAALRQKVGDVLKAYDQPALVEAYLPGREFTAALLGNGPDVRVLPLIEMDFSVLPVDANPLYSYEAKWVWDKPADPLPLFQCPADVDDALEHRIEATARQAFCALRCRDWARIDLRLDGEGVPHIIEVNPLPGILPKPEDNSCFPKAARAAGLSYEDLILAVVDQACKRYGIA